MFVHSHAVILMQLSLFPESFGIFRLLTDNINVKSERAVLLPGLSFVRVNSIGP